MKTTLTVLLIIKLCGLVSCAVKYHTFITKESTWIDALRYCRGNYRDLSTFTDDIEEQQFLKDAVAQSAHAWIGLNKTLEFWWWAGEKVAKQISWDDQQPENGNCAYLNKDQKKLHDATCSNQFPFFCMRFEFFMVQRSESWDGALEYCRHHYDDLASLPSSRSREYALNKITGAQTQYVWIGLRFLAGEWSWVSGYNLHPVFKVLLPECPASNQWCGALQKNTNTFITRDCEEKLNFLCV